MGDTEVKGINNYKEKKKPIEYNWTYFHGYEF